MMPSRLAPWFATPLLRASLALHAVCLPALLSAPLRIPALLALVANHGVIALVGLLPRSRGLGPNLTRLPPAAAARGWIAITIDDGPDPEVTPAVLEVLAAAGARATFFCIGERAAQHPDLCRRILAEGHAIENHGARHFNHVSLCGPAGWRREVLGGRALIAGVIGREPRFFRALAGLRNPFLAPVLQQAGLTLVSWTRRGYDTRCQDDERVFRRLTDGLAAGDILLLHDGHAARTAKGTPVIVAVLPRILAIANQRQLACVTLAQACPPN